MSDETPRKLDQIRPIQQVDEFLVVERVFSEDAGLPSVGLANIHAQVPDIEANKEKILRACQIFKERGANMAIFPEFCLSGYFWEDEDACWAYMNEAVTENHRDWIDGTLKSVLDEEFRLIVLNNITRGAILALAAAMAGTNSMNVCAYDEALGIPTEESHLLTLRTQQIVLHETDATCVGDPLAGSYYLEDLTDKIEKAANGLIDKMDEMGGFVEAVESGWLQGLIAEQSYRTNEEIRKGEQILVGVNRYQVEEEPRPVFRVESETEQKAIQRMQKLKEERDPGQVRKHLDQVRAIAREDGEELMPAIIQAAEVYCTQQEVMDILKEEYGWRHMKNC